MTDQSYQACGEGQICLDLRLSVPSLVPHGSMYLSVLNDPSVLISMTGKPWISYKMGQCTVLIQQCQESSHN
jgi:hypothetical protein